MSEETVGQRLKSLIAELSLDVRSFCKALDVSETTVRNYFNRGSNPNAEFLTKLTTTFRLVNLSWLLTGQGSPFFPPTNENDIATTSNQKFFRSQIVGNNQGTNSQNENRDSGELNSLKSQLLLAQNNNEHLRAQLEMKDALLASKEDHVKLLQETINLLRAAYTRPN